MIKITINGKEVIDGLDRVIAALDPDAQKANFETVMQFVHGEVKSHTPGSGHLREGWRLKTEFSKREDGWSFSGQIFNDREEELLTYRQAITGQVKPKLKANDEQQRYRDVLPILDKGSKPHVILPRRYKNLVFRASKSPPPGDPDTSNLVITKHVSHPGTKAYGTLTIPYQKLLTLCQAAVLSTEEQVIKAW